ncbi:DUF4097 family beta strand repeat-containing protein [Silvibacterium dinghuense]|uniref:Adhesin domain-containing protein n=1 Tax=Silvibacterium dinghuense TaxID=1560006 RepID=A0A4Q1SIG0_9BACT|nr:DUF4097 family beta strand repeat-containing protein [Silvibacterium dinghuense]RXS97391.1 hypothetical protein ESZ00_05670 [Silvibacterium dinghuense]GGG98617.1 hypothetical protein GCM10011586_12550 [Silvibacterium dinghuense]
MAAAPPPYSPRDAARQARDYARWQRDQMRAQRQYWRGYRRASITGPIVLLTVGIIALLIETGHLNGFDVWNWYARWWPVILIAVGVVSLGEYFFDRDNPYAGRRSFGGIVFLVLFFAFLGWGTHQAHHWGPFAEQFGDNGNDFFSLMGEEHDNDVQLSQAIPVTGAVSVQNPRGDVTITASADNQVHLRAHQVVHTNADDRARELFTMITPKIETSPSGAVINVPGNNAGRVDLTLELPEKLATTINAGHGDVTISGMKNSVDVSNNHGDVKFDDITGDVHAHMDHGDVSAHQITGHALIDGRADDITLSEVKGDVGLNGDFFGDTHLEQVSSGVHFHTSRTDLDMQHLGGDLSMDSSDLSASQITGPVRIVTHSKNIDLTQVAGDVHIENSDGDINIAAALPLGNIQVSNRSGGLSVTVPSNAGFTISGSTTQDDDIETDFPLANTESGDRRSLSGTVGKGGVKIDLTTSHGTLELKKGSNLELPPAPPAPPAPPKPPVNAKHFKAPQDVPAPKATEQ